MGTEETIVCIVLGNGIQRPKRQHYLFLKFRIPVLITVLDVSNSWNRVQNSCCILVVMMMMPALGVLRNICIKIRDAPDAGDNPDPPDPVIRNRTASFTPDSKLAGW